MQFKVTLYVEVNEKLLEEGDNPKAALEETIEDTFCDDAFVFTILKPPEIAVLSKKIFQWDNRKENIK